VFIVVMALFGYVLSPWAICACRPRCSSVSPSRAWDCSDLVHADLAGLRQVSLAIIPMFLFSATFYPLSVYPGWLQLVVRATPLYQAVALERGLDAGRSPPRSSATPPTSPSSGSPGWS